MTLWQHIKEDGGFGLFDYLGSRMAFTAAQWERWWAMPVCMLVGALLTLVAIPVTFAWLLVHLCIWAYRRARRLLRPLWAVLMVRAGWPHPFSLKESQKSKDDDWQAVNLNKPTGPDSVKVDGLQTFERQD